MIRAVALLILGLVASGCSGRTVWLSAADPVGMDRLTAEVRRSPVIFVGEFHDRTSHHDLQLQVIRALEVQGVPLIIGLEMFDMESQPALDQWGRGDLAIDDFASLYQKNWTIAWSEYDRILLYARNRRIPLYGLNVPQDLASRVSRYGWQSLRAEEMARLPAGVTADTSADYREFLATAFGDHRLSPTLFEYFCEAQGLRNNSMALLIKDALRRHPGATMVVITGVGHAMRRAVADLLGPELAGKARVIVPYAEGLFRNIDESDADFIVTE